MRRVRGRAARAASAGDIAPGARERRAAASRPCDRRRVRAHQRGERRDRAARLLVERAGALRRSRGPRRRHRRRCSGGVPRARDLREHAASGQRRARPVRIATYDRPERRRDSAEAARTRTRCGLRPDRECRCGAPARGSARATPAREEGAPRAARARRRVVVEVGAVGGSRRRRRCHGAERRDAAGRERRTHRRARRRGSRRPPRYDDGTPRRARRGAEPYRQRGRRRTMRSSTKKRACATSAAKRPTFAR